MPRVIALIPVLLLISSCAAMVTQRKAVDSLMDSIPCCTSMAEFRYEPLPSGEPVAFRLDQNSDSFVFPSGKSYFKAFNLPEMKLPYPIQVKSFALGESINSAHVFYPKILLLDDHFAVRKVNAPVDFSLTKSGLKETSSVSWGLLRLKLETSFLVDIPDAKYLVIYTTRELMESKTSEYMANQMQPIPIPVPGGLIIGAIPLDPLPVNIPHSPFGWIYIKAGY